MLSRRSVLLPLTATNSITLSHSSLVVYSHTCSYNTNRITYFSVLHYGFIHIKWQPHPKYKANSELLCRLGTRFSLKNDRGRVNDGADRGPVDRDGARKTKIITQCRFNSRPKSEPRQVCLAVEAFPFA